MGIFGAMTTAVSGLKAQSYAMENISGNIANSRTTGFKRVDTSFVDLIPDRPTGQDLSGSVRGFAQSTNTIQGDLSTTGVSENIAINGSGFFVVSERTGYSGGVPTFGGIDVYTRRGDFQLDNSSYLVNGAGYYLKGIPIDPQTGTLRGSTPQLVRIDKSNVPPKATATIEYGAVLPQSPDTAFYTANKTVAGSRLVGAGAAPYGASPTTISQADAQLFIDRSIAGGSITVYNDQGAARPMSLRWGKIADTPTEQWGMYYQANTDGTTNPAWVRVNTFNFDTAGRLTSAANSTIPAFTLDGVQYAGALINASSLQSFPPNDTVGVANQANVTKLQQDGYPSGQFQSISIDNSGRVVGNYSNNQVVGLAQIVVANFAAENALKRRDGGVYEATLESGQPIIGQAGSNVVGGTVENSNTDIADEFSKMIVTQQAYSANTRVISTSSDMLRDIINIVR